VSPTNPISRAPLNPAHWVRQRFQRWWQSRLPLSDQLVLTQRNVYILPTRAGFMWAATVLVLLVAAINYQLNLGYLLTFMLAGCALVSMHISHRNLRGVQLVLAPPAAAFEGGAVALHIRLINPARRTRYGLGLAVHDSHAAWVWADLPPEGQASLQLSHAVHQRGRHRVPTLSAQTLFPLGSFRVWTVWRPAATMWVYPAPEAHAPPWPAGEGGHTGGALAHAASSGAFDGVRSYRRGDTPRQVVWKKAANAIASGAGELVSRDNEQQRSHTLWLDHAQAGPAALKWSRLCAWVLRAQAMGLHYGLRLPGRVIAPNQGEAHQRACLEALALC